VPDATSAGSHYAPQGHPDALPPQMPPLNRMLPDRKNVTDAIVA